MVKEILYHIRIPDYPRKILLAKSRRAQYWLKHKVLAGTQKLPKKYLKEVPFNSLEHEKIIMFDKKEKTNITYILNKDVCYWKQHKLSKTRSEQRLTADDTDEYIIKNTQVAGTERWDIINGQKIYNAGYHPSVRAKVMELIHNWIEPHVREHIKPITDTYPLGIEAHIYDLEEDEITKGQAWDVTNRGYPFCKAFDDVLQKCGIIPDDDRKHIVIPCHPIFHPVQPTDNHGFIDFKIYHIKM